MTLRKLEALSVEDLRNLLTDEDIDNKETLSREELTDLIREMYGEEDSPENANAAKFVNTLLDSQTQLESLRLPSIADIPQSYNETYIHAMLRDNCWVYVYWDIAESVCSKLKDEGVENYSFVLRTVKLGSDGRAEDFYDIEIQTTDRDWNVTLPSSASSYKIQLVLKYGEYAIVQAESAVLETPDSYWFSHADELRADKDACRLLFAPVISKGKFVLDYPVIKTLAAKTAEKEK